MPPATAAAGEYVTSLSSAEISGSGREAHEEPFHTGAELPPNGVKYIVPAVRTALERTGVAEVSVSRPVGPVTGTAAFDTAIKARRTYQVAFVAPSQEIVAT